MPATYTTDQVVTRDDWNNGKPVRILHTHTTADGVAVRYQDVGARKPARQVVVPNQRDGGQR